MDDKLPPSTDGAGTAHRRERKGVGLRARIALPLLLPLVGLLALSGLLLTERLATVTAMQRVDALAELITDTSALVHEVQRERGASGGFLTSKGADLAQELTAQRARTDARLAVFDARLRQIDSGRSAPAAGGLSAKLRGSRDALAAVGDMRRQISQLATTAENSFAYYTTANTYLLDMIGEAASDVEAPDVARSVSGYLSFLQAKELAGQERAIGTVGFAADRFDAARLRRLVTLGDQQDLYFRIIAAAVTPAQNAYMRQTIAGDAVDTLARMRRTAAEGGLSGNLGGITGAEWFKAATVRVELLKRVEDRMAGDLALMTTEIRDAARTELIAALAAIAVLLALTGAVATVMIRAVVRPLGHHIRTMQHLAEGKTDILITGVERRDELGSMARAIEVFRDHAVENQRLAGEQLAERERTQAARLTAMAAMAEKIEAEARDAMTEIGERTAAMAVVANNMSGSAGRTGTSAESAAAAGAIALANAQAVASAAEQLAASIQEIGGQVNQSTQVIARAVDAGRTTRETIGTLNEQVGRIGSVADMIGEIAAKTNLLALNATIEAARAGEAGKGFAVVASEVKQLAMQTARSTEEIGRHISEVRRATSASVAAVGRIDDTIGEVNAIAGSIAAAVEEQSAATAEIAHNVTETASAANQMTERTSEVCAEAARTGHEAAEVLDNTTALNATVQGLRRALVQVVRTSTRDVDRRQERRRPCLVEVDITCNGQSEAVMLHDVSEQGCFAVTKSDHRIAESVELSIRRLGRRLRGSVVERAEGGIHIDFTGDRLPSADVDRISLVTVAELVKLSKNDHLAFVASVAGAAASGEAPNGGLATHHNCRLGRWYDSLSDTATLALPSFRAIAAPHHAVHDFAHRVLNAIAANDAQAVQRHLDEVRQHSDRVLRCLDEFEAEYPSTITLRPDRDAA